MRRPPSRSLLKHNKFKPPSLELKEDLHLEEQSLHAILHAKAATADGARTTLAAASCAATAAALAVRARPSSAHSMARGPSAAQVDGGRQSADARMPWALCDTAESERADRTLQRRCAERPRDVWCSLAAAHSLPGGVGRALARHCTAAAAHRPKLSYTEMPCA